MIIPHSCSVSVNESTVGDRSTRISRETSSYNDEVYSSDERSQLARGHQLERSDANISINK